MVEVLEYSDVGSSIDSCPTDSSRVDTDKDQQSEESDSQFGSQNSEKQQITSNCF